MFLVSKQKLIAKVLPCSDSATVEDSPLLQLRSNPSIRGVMAISTSGYDTDVITVDENTDPDAYLFYRSIDPDTLPLEDISLTP